MALSNLFTNWAVKLHTQTAQSGAAVYVEGVSDVSLNSNLRTAVEGGDGLPYNTFGSLVGGGPTATFTTSDLKAALDECGVTGMLIDSSTNPGVVLYFQKFAQGSTRAAANGSVHHSTTIGDGLMVPRTLSMSHQGLAQITYELFATGSSPLTFSETADIPAGVSTDVDIAFTLGPVDLNGTAVSGVSSVSVDFGINVITEAGDSDIYPTIASITTIQPSITVTASHIDITSTLTEAGAYYASGVEVYCKKRSEGGTVVADGTAEHVKIALNKCRVDWTTIAGNPKAISLRMTPWYSVTPTTPLTITTASAIT